MRVLLVACGVIVAVACIAVANLVLLGYGNGSRDPVGRLDPVARLPSLLPPSAPGRPSEPADSRDD